MAKIESKILVEVAEKIEKEIERVEYGKVSVEFTIHKDKSVNYVIQTRNSTNIPT